MKCKSCTKIYLPRSQENRKREIFVRAHLGRKKRTKYGYKNNSYTLLS